MALMKILCWYVFIERTVSVVTIIVFVKLDMVLCCCCSQFFLEEEFELDVVLLRKKINILQNRTIMKGVSSLIADSTWSAQVKGIVYCNFIHIICYNVVKCIANFIWHITACRIIKNVNRLDLLFAVGALLCSGGGGFCQGGC